MSIANYFVQRALNEKCTDFTILKMMKLVYIAHGFQLAVFKQSFFDDAEDFVQAWQYGPVIPSVYNAFKAKYDKYINGKVDTRAELDPDDPDEADAMKVCNFVWNMYGDKRAFSLVDMLHAPGTPWVECYTEGKKNTIPDYLTAEYFSSLWEDLKPLLIEAQQKKMQPGC